MNEQADLGLRLSICHKVGSVWWISYHIITSYFDYCML